MVPVSAIADDPAQLAAFVRESERLAREQAVRSGVALNGQPTMTTEPFFIVPNWSDEGDGMVGEAVARMAGVTGPPSGLMVTWTWADAAPAPLSDHL